MKLIDLSVVIDNDTPVYPGDPQVKIEPLGTFEKDSYNDHYISFPTHTGTHIDAPLHMIEKGESLEQFPLDNFVGRGKLVDGLSIEAVKKANIQEDDIILFYTRWSDNLQEANYFENSPELSEEAAKYLIDKKAKMVGFDMPSPDHPPYNIHRLLLGSSVLIIENLTNLDKLHGKEFVVYALPIKLAQDGAPARVVAQVK